MHEIISEPEQVLDHRSGWRVRRYMANVHEEELELVLSTGTESVTSVSTIVPVQRYGADVTRDAMFLRAIAAYLNSGGAVERVEELAKLAAYASSQANFHIPDGYELMDTVCDDGDLYIHTFVNIAERNVLCFCEDCYVEIVPLSDFAAECGEPYDQASQLFTITDVGAV